MELNSSQDLFESPKPASGSRGSHTLNLSQDLFESPSSTNNTPSSTNNTPTPSFTNGTPCSTNNINNSPCSTNNTNNSTTTNNTPSASDNTPSSTGHSPSLLAGKTHYYHVPGYCEWYNVKFENDWAIYTCELLDDCRRGDVQILV